MLATALWGLAFLITRTGVSEVPVLPFLVLRFLTAAAIVRGLTGVRVTRASPVEYRAGLLLGCAMLAGYGLQAEGLRSIGAGRAAFLSALYVPMVPLLQFLAFRRVPRPPVLVGIALACAGLVLMAGPATARAGSFAPGDLFVLAAAGAVSVEITLIGHFAARVDPRRLAILECLTVGTGALVLTFANGTALPAPRPAWIACALGLGAASAFLQVSSNWAMRRVAPTRATLIYATEPVWGASFGALAGERMSAEAVGGAALILVALVLNAWPSGHRQ